MNKEKYTDILSDPDNAGSDSLIVLEELIDQFPYFQTARMLHLKLLKSQDSVHYRKNLKTTSAHAGDRTKLFHFINGGDLKQMQESAMMGHQVDEEQKIEISQEPVKEEEITEQPLIPDVSEKSTELENVIVDEEATEVTGIPVVEENENPEETEKIEDPVVKDEQNKSIYFSDLSPQEILAKRLQEIRDNKANENPEEEVADEIEEQDEVIPELSAIAEENVEADIVADLPEEIKPIEEKYSDEESVLNEDSNEVAEIFEIDSDRDIEEVSVPDLESDQGSEQENIVEPIEPSDFNLSFIQWLQQMKTIDGASDPRRIQRVEAPAIEKDLFEPVNDQSQSQEQIIDHFIKSNPRIEQTKAEFYSAQDMAKRSIEESDELVSETLAKVYADQGLQEKATQIYKQLSLKYPQKKAYFAARIQEIKDSGSIK